MRSYAEAKADRERIERMKPENRVAENKCPVCPGELDTGWECLDCGYDAQPIAHLQESTSVERAERLT